MGQRQCETFLNSRAKDWSNYQRELRIPLIYIQGPLNTFDGYLSNQGWNVMSAHYQLLSWNSLWTSWTFQTGCLGNPIMYLLPVHISIIWARVAHCCSLKLRKVYLWTHTLSTSFSWSWYLSKVRRDFLKTATWTQGWTKKRLKVNGTSQKQIFVYNSRIHVQIMMTFFAQMSCREKW